jgi:hypothetical protein
LKPDRVGEKASGLWEVDSLGHFVRSFFTIDELYPVIYSHDNGLFDLLPQGKISLRDAQFDDLYSFEGDSLKKLLTYNIKNSKLSTFKGITYTPEKYTKSYTSQAKGHYIFTIWSDGTESFFTVYDFKEKKSVLVYPAKAFWSKQQVIYSGVNILIDSNLTDALITDLTGEAIANYLQQENASPKIKQAAQEIIQGMTEKDIEEMNPVLQILYVKK